MAKLATIEELRSRLRIDKHRLDDELIEQASLYFEVSEQQVLAVAQRDALKEEVSTVDAELDSIVRKELEKKSAKYTEAMVKGGIAQHKHHLAAFDAYVAAKQKADKLTGLLESFRQRGQMLRELCGLYSTNYFNRDSVAASAPVTEARANRAKDLAHERRTQRHRERL